MSALQELYRYLYVGQTPPFDWIVEHVPDGTIKELWNEERDPEVMIGLAERVDFDAAMEVAAELVLSTRRLVTAPSKSMEAVFDDVANRRHSATDGKRLAEYRAFIRNAFATASEIDAVGAALSWVENDGEYSVASILRKVISALRGAPVTTSSIRDPRSFVADVIRERIPCPPLTDLLSSRDT